MGLPRAYMRSIQLIGFRMHRKSYNKFRGVEQSKTICCQRVDSGRWFL